MTDIVERVRWLASGQDDPQSQELIACADEIERLQSINAKLNKLVQWQDTELERLREALQWYADNCSRNGDAIEGPSGDYGQRAKCALMGVEYKQHD